LTIANMVVTGITDNATSLHSQCTRRGLTCVYPTESRRGMRKKMVLTGPNPVVKIRARPKGKKNAKSASATVVPEFDRVELTPVPP
jgi:hypothetical protein